MIARVLVLGWLRPWTFVQGAGVGLIALAVGVEGQAQGSADPLLRTGLLVWARLSPALALLGAAYAWRRLSALRMTLQALGLTEGWVRLGAVPLGAVLGLARLGCGWPQAEAWVRAEGGWYYFGQAMPDVVGGQVMPPAVAFPWVTAAMVLSAGAAGARTWSPLGLFLAVALGLVGPTLIGEGPVILSFLCAALWPGRPVSR